MVNKKRFGITIQVDDSLAEKLQKASEILEKQSGMIIGMSNILRASMNEYCDKIIKQGGRK